MQNLTLTPYRPQPGPVRERTACARMITSQDEFSKHYRDMVPAVDWDRHVLVAVHSGQRPTGGYWVRLESVEVGAQLIRVQYREGAPGPDDMVTLAFTHPAAYGLLSRAELPAQATVEFIGSAGKVLASQEITISGR